MKRVLYTHSNSDEIQMDEEKNRHKSVCTMYFTMFSQNARKDKSTKK